MAENLDDLKKGLKKQIKKTNLTQEGKKKVRAFKDKLDVESSEIRRAMLGPKTHTVASGDSLSSIAKKYGKADWKVIYEANKVIIGDDPSKIRVGQELKIPK